MPSIYGFSVRSSGRDLTAVRRPRPRMAPALPVDLASLPKADLINWAEARGVDSTGTKAQLLERLGVAHG